MTPAAEQVLGLRRAAESQTRRLDPLYFAEPWLAGVVLLAAAPLLIVACAIIALLSHRTPVVRHRRVGWRGRELRMLKLRTMWDPGQRWGPIFSVEDLAPPVPANKSDGDERVTSRFAAWCRRYSIDELPQLLHVVLGEMSLVGPRPITRAELDEHYGESANTVLKMRPGLTGLWQIKGRSKLTYRQRRRLDLWLAGHATPGLYWRILLKSIPAVWSGSNAC